MHKIDAPGHSSNTFTDGDPLLGTQPTQLWSKYMNTIQNELVNLVEGAGLVLNQSDDTQLLQAVQGIIGGNAMRNVCLNGDFRFWQRSGTESGNLPQTLTSGASIWADKWWMRNGSTAGSASIDRMDFTVGQVEVPGSPKHFLSWNQTVAATGSDPVMIQPIEDVATFAARTATVSFWGKVASGTTTVKLALRQDFGAGGSPSSDVDNESGGLTLTTSWQKFSYTVALATISGKTIGTTAHRDYLGAELRFPQSVTFTASIADFQVELGSAASAFDRRHDTFELLLLERWYEKSYLVAVKPGKVGETIGASITAHDKAWASTSGEVYGLQMAFRTRKPDDGSAVSWYAPLDGSINKINYDTSNTEPVSSTGGGTSNTGWPLLTDISGTPANIKEAVGAWVIDAERPL